MDRCTSQGLDCMYQPKLADTMFSCQPLARNLNHPGFVAGVLTWLIIACSFKLPEGMGLPNLKGLKGFGVVQAFSEIRGP